MKWQFTLNHSLLAMRLLSQKSSVREFGTAVIFLIVVASSAMANTSSAKTPNVCADAAINEAFAESTKECSTLAFNVPLLYEPALSSGPELGYLHR